MNAGGGTSPAREFRSGDEADTESLGAAFARAFSPEAGRAVRVALCGELGAGKTTFVRGLLRALGVAGPIRSPTYSLVERHRGARAEILHADLYRLAGADEFAALAFDDADRDCALWLVEWPERAGGALPPPDLRVELRVADAEHRLRFVATTAAGQAWLARAAPDAALEVASPAP